VSGAGLDIALEVAGLHVSLGGTAILRDLAFRIPAGTTLAVIGPNGAGKTVLFRALIGAVPASGRIRWAPDTRLGYVPQKLDIERDLPLAATDLLAAKARLVHGEPGEIVRVLTLVDLSTAVARQPIGTLSGGQFQRLLVAFALIGSPTVLLFDEPTAGIDAPGEASIYALLRRLQHEHRLTVLMISHELSLVCRFADAVLCLGRGRTCLGPPLEVLTPERLHEIYGAPMKFHLHDDRRD
jgi:zinc transport system ATP-binding protein